MNKGELLKELRRANDNYSPQYQKLMTVSRVLLYIAIGILIIGVIVGIIIGKDLGVVSFLTTLVSSGVAAAIFYAISAATEGLATIVLNTKRTSDLLSLKIMLENDLINK